MAKATTDPRLALARKLSAAKVTVALIEAEVNKLAAADKALVGEFLRLLVPSAPRKTRTTKPKPATDKKVMAPVKPTLPKPRTNPLD